jgi:hypothetical protein
MIHLLLAIGVLFQDKTEYTVEQGTEAVVVKCDGKEVLRYQLQKPADSKLTVESACYFHPLTTPSGVVLTDVAPDDHKHHRGIFLAWFEMHGKKDADYWGWGQYSPVKDRLIVNRSHLTQAQGALGVLRLKNEWMAEDIMLVKEELLASISKQGPANILDLIYILSVDADVTLPQRAFSGFCLRARKDGKATVEGPEGEIKLPAPNHLKPETDWPAQRWYGLAITLPDGTKLGGAVINHPKNPASLWHNPVSNRMINPCVIAPKELVLKAGAPLMLQYRVLAWDGAIPRKVVNDLAAGYCE